MTPTLNLPGFTFEELFHSAGLKRLDQTFLHFLESQNPFIHKTLLNYRDLNFIFEPVELSEFLIESGRYLENFLSSLFNIEDAVEASRLLTVSHNPLFVFKKFYVLKQAKKNLLKAKELPSFNELTDWLNTALKGFSLKTHDLELQVALLGNSFLVDTLKHQEEIEKLTAWCTQALATSEGQSYTRNWVSFRIPKRLDYQSLVEPLTTDQSGRLKISDDHLRLRDGFKLTDPRMSAREVQNEVHYCIYCHDHDGDFCSKGFPQKKGHPELGFKKNPLNVTLTGCPLEEKISEMNVLKRDGFTLASLAVVMIDNPMCPATGHRICNDCMKACIYQKQEPVNIPEIETRVLDDVLHLPWGVEIYDLLTRWNPLRRTQYVMKPYNGLKVLIAGMGPAGFTLAHHLLLEGFGVVGFDGLKIEPLPDNLLKKPIYSFKHIKEELDERLMAGFGGVAEYGITVRWDKNFLKLIYISLARKPYFQVFGNVRFGGTIHVEDAWKLGFDHLSVAVGAGLPKALSIPGSLAPGMRQANDFLMALQLGNAAKMGSLTNLQVRLPAVVIGGGLTGVDTATELQAYYIKQVEKVLTRYEKLIQVYGEDQILKKLDLDSLDTLNEFLAHGQMVRSEREIAGQENRQPNFVKLIHEWGGVTIVYRRTMQESPAYINNHEELKKALEEGVFYLEDMEPVKAELDSNGYVEHLICQRRSRDTSADQLENTIDLSAQEIRIPARSILIATGTQPNIAYEFEHKGTFARLGFQYQHYEDVEGELTVSPGIAHCKEPDFGPFTSYKHQDHRVSLIGDTHPVFHGNVVKAIASAYRTYPKILATLKDKLNKVGSDQEYESFAEKMTGLFTSKVVDIKRPSENVLELTVKSPLAAKHYQPGQFYRIQNFESFAPKVNHTSCLIEPLAMTAAAGDSAQGILKFIILEKGASSKLCATFKEGDPIALMGPTGIRAKVSLEHETILIVGDNLSLAYVLSYGTTLREKGNKVLFLGCFSKREEVYFQDQIEKATDAVIWCINSGELITPKRNTDVAGKGDPIELLLSFSHGKLSQEHKSNLSLKDIDRIYVIGSTELMRQFQQQRNLRLKDYLLKNPRVFGSVYSTMQCMLKGVCAQCLQWQIDPETGRRTKAVFACSWPEQPLELIDFDNLDERQSSNKLQEHMSSLWVDYLLKDSSIRQV